jgi:hypothetical protein
MELSSFYLIVAQSGLVTDRSHYDKNFHIVNFFGKIYIKTLGRIYKAVYTDISLWGAVMTYEHRK